MSQSRKINKYVRFIQRNKANTNLKRIPENNLQQNIGENVFYGSYVSFKYWELEPLSH